MSTKVFSTARFDVFRDRVERNPELGSGRDVYTAWHHSEDVPRSVCEITICPTIEVLYVEWIHVCETTRRQGIATEVLSGLEQFIGQVVMDGATEAGEAFCDCYAALPEAESEAP